MCSIFITFLNKSINLKVSATKFSCLYKEAEMADGSYVTLSHSTGEGSPHQPLLSVTNIGRSVVVWNFMLSEWNKKWNVPSAAYIQSNWLSHFPFYEFAVGSLFYCLGNHRVEMKWIPLYLMNHFHQAFDVDRMERKLEEMSFNFLWWHIYH